MKLIAHRGASLNHPENSLDSLIHAACSGADAVECDVRLSADGIPLIYHDADLARLTGQPLQLAAAPYAQIKSCLAAVGRSVHTLEEVLAESRIGCDLLLHLKIEPVPPVVLEQLRPVCGRIICGISSRDSLAQVRSFMCGDRILAFVDQWQEIAAFIRGGAGIIRLWENWLDDIQPATVKAMGPVQVWIMSRQADSMDGSVSSLQTFKSLGADGALLNDIEMALRWRSAV